MGETDKWVNRGKGQMGIFVGNFFSDILDSLLSCFNNPLTPGLLLFLTAGKQFPESDDRDENQDDDGAYSYNGGHIPIY